MKFVIMAGELADTVGWTAHALPKRAAAPVLNGMLLEADDGTVTVSAFDYDTSRQATVDLDTAVDPGRVLVPGRLLADIVKALPKKGLVDVAADDREIVIQCGRARYGFPLLPVEDYPRLPKLPAAVGSVSTKMFGYAVAEAAVAAGSDSSLPMTTGVHLEAADGLINLAATDRYRIAWRKLTWSPVLDAAPVKALIPAKTLHDIARGLPDDTSVQICVDGGMAAFVAAGRTTTVRLIDEQFIDVPAKFAAIEKTTKVVATVDAGELAKVVKRVSLMATRSAPVRLSFTQDSVLVEAGDSAEGRASEQADCTLQGDDLQVAFTVGYLLDVLGAFAGPVQLHAPVLKDFASKPVEFRRGADDEYRHMVMPVRVDT